MRKPKAAFNARKQAEGRRIAQAAYPVRCCVICGLANPAWPGLVHLAHLNHRAGDNRPDNLAFFCSTHHQMFDARLYPKNAIKLMRAWWQKTKGKPSHKARMKDAGVKAHATRRRNAEAQRIAAEEKQRMAIRSAAARKAWATRRAMATAPKRLQK